MNTFKFLFTILFISFVSIAQAQVAPVDDKGVAIGGYDVVAYFSDQAQKGHKKNKATHNGVTYYFKTKENRDTFKKNPTQFLPQFDGYCAWGVAEKQTKFPINPETFDIVDGKLYLFFNGPFKGQNFNTIQPWNAETTRLLQAAHSNWNTVKKS
ncbi:YHS domain-containing (seleno)protein [Aquimarina rhabdastrellae]